MFSYVILNFTIIETLDFLKKFQQCMEMLNKIQLISN